MKTIKRLKKILKIFTLSIALIISFSLPLVHAQGKERVHKKLRFGVAAMISPKDTINVYRQIIYYVGEKLGVPIEMVQRRTYAEMNDLLEKKNLYIAFICSGPYVNGKEKFDVELLVAPQSYGKCFYYSYFIVPKISTAVMLEDLKGKKIAFTDPNSNTGCLVPTYVLAKKNETPETFFSSYFYSGHHSESIKLVAEGKVDGAAVDHLIWEYMNATDPEFTSKTKVIFKSEPYGMPPVVVHPDIDPVLKKKIKDILLNMHKDEFGKKILKKVFIDEFIVPDDKDYDSVREMRDWINKNKENTGK
ncbi:MAG: phosphate/phosphite/phosphonate ABC transporter substrate-binding protein [Candidatus Aureabacteria bacterium]|nr:phosphate/phosphite/phosphonate ABC transporter substrate-binding protein [Candidatus Auribacterota bacterium]